MFRRALVAVVLSLGVTAGLASAQEPGCSSCQGDTESGGRAQRLLGRLYNVPVNCQTHHNDLGCGSLKSEFLFVFSGCRVFFGQPCVKNPPHGALQPTPGAPLVAPGVAK